MESNEVYSQDQISVPVPVANPLRFTAADKVYAFLCVALGFLFFKLLFKNFGLSLSLYVFIFFACALAYLICQKAKIGIFNTVALGVLLLLGCNFFMSSNIFIKFLNILFLILASVYWFFATSGNREGKKIDIMFIFDVFKALLIPFMHLERQFFALRAVFAKKTWVKKLPLVILALVITLPLTALIIFLLMQSNEAFAGFINLIFSNFFDDFLKNLVINGFLFIISIPVSMYFFSMFYANTRKLDRKLLSYEKNKKTMQAFKIAPRLIGYIIMIPAIIVYLLYFISQLAYITSVFQNILPEEYTLAQFAKAGFGELCVVAFINICIICGVNILSEHKDGKPTPLNRILSAVFAVMTLGLVGTMLWKMKMYMDGYGLTINRIYATWFILGVGLIFMAVLAKQFFLEFPTAKIIILGITAMFLILSFSRLDGVIAKYNIDSYRNGNLKELDVEMLTRLSDGAVPYICSLVEEDNEEIANEAKNYVAGLKVKFENHDGFNSSVFNYNHWLEFNFESYRARKAVENVNIERGAMRS